MKRKSAQLDVEAVRARIAVCFRAHGIEVDRVILEGRSARNLEDAFAAMCARRAQDAASVR
ncbi:hypothetical protein [Caballeronia choica]|uniref:hypothetical protein n=1 Tax=Caballeronia choica TaxID=326476 RepID=UPI000B3E5D26|nr:hypothetical protein [Caballeronia choica]